MTGLSQTRRTATALLLIAIAATAWLLAREALRTSRRSSSHDVVSNPGYQHAHRLEIATTRAAMDVLGMTGADHTAEYQSDYRLQRMQIQADSLGLERWAVQDTRRQGLLLEIRASVAGLVTAMDQAAGSESTNAAAPQIPLLQALNRAQTALNDYIASLTEPMRQTAPGPRYLLAIPIVLWWLLIFVLVELAILAWLIFAPSRKNRFTI